MYDTSYFPPTTFFLIKLTHSITLKTRNTLSQDTWEPVCDKNSKTIRHNRRDYNSIYIQVLECAYYACWSKHTCEPLYLKEKNAGRICLLNFLPTWFNITNHYQSVFNIYNIVWSFGLNFEPRSCVLLL